MNLGRVVEYVFFFGLLMVVGYLVWLIMSPFITALALSAIIVTIFHPLYLSVKERVPKQNKTVAAFFTTMIVFLVIILPLSLITAVIAKESVGLYHDFSTGDTAGIQAAASNLEARVQALLPGLEIAIGEQLATVGEWFIGNIGTIFASTISILFTFILSMLGSFYFFRDGKELMQLLIRVSPLPDGEDEIIFERMARAVRSVAMGTLLIALIQGTLVALGFTIFGIPRAVLWGMFASLGALMPGIGTTIVTAPAIIYLFVTGDTVMAVGLLVWSILIVGLVDNLVGPYLIGRKNNMHPFIILISVLGGIGLFGPIGFIIGPVTVTLFFVLLEIYNQYIIKDKEVPDEDFA
jgi:predicted PurR-regulated permease PerM